MREFTTAAKVASEDEEAVLGVPVSVKVDDYEVTFMPANEGQIATLLAGTAAASSRTEEVGATINFFFGLIDDEDAERHFRRRLFDKNDSFSVDSIGEIVSYLIEEWTARPTKQPSDFTRSEGSTGGKSTGHQRRHKAASTS